MGAGGLNIGATGFILLLVGRRCVDGIGDTCLIPLRGHRWFDGAEVLAFAFRFAFGLESLDVVADVLVLAAGRQWGPVVRYFYLLSLSSFGLRDGLILAAMEKRLRFIG
jgi:hypothetical protein